MTYFSLLRTVFLTALLWCPGFAGAVIKIEGIPHVEQRPDFCGEACVEMFTRKLGYRVTQDEVFALTGLAPERVRGAHTAELKKALQALGFKTGAGSRWVAAKDAKRQIWKEWAKVVSDLKRGTPTIICMRTSTKADATEHFRLVTGWDAEKKELLYHEPATGDNGAYRRMKFAELEVLWPLKYRATQWGLVRLPLAVPDGKLNTRAIPAAIKGFSRADYMQHLYRLKTKGWLKKGFNAVVSEPFVVIGNDTPSRVRARAQGTVRWAVRHLKQSFFTKNPEEILTIWLFKDAASYRKYCKAFWDDEPDTPYGYYSHTHKALVMNIATGGGTLVHEIVHPFVQANFPDCPSWLNEGLGTLYEQSGEKKGQIHGYTNWRLAGLQKAIKAKRTEPLTTMMGTTQNEFYGAKSGIYYAQARYLCYYLQEKKKLRAFYKEFHANADSDAGGLKSFQKVTGVKDMKAFQKHWETWAMTLRFPMTGR